MLGIILLQLMAAEVLSVKKGKSPGFMTLLSSAVCEWFLIFLLFVDAAFSYLLTKFAQYCEIKTPCPLCSRLDLVSGKKKPENYWSLLCRSHREEMSSLVPCSIHNNLADVNGMCEECFMPIIMQHKSNSESYRLLVGKLWVDVERSILQNLMLNKNIRFGSSGRRTCSCCNKIWRAKSNAERLLGLSPVSLGASKANLKPPLPRVPGRSRFSRRDSLKRLREKFSGPMAHHSALGNSFDTLSHVGYTKLKISSDSESEVLFSEDDEEGNASCRCKIESKPDYNVQSSLKSPPITQDEKVKPSVLDLPNLLDLSDDKTFSSLSVDTFIEHELRELNWAEAYNKPSTFVTPELASLDNSSQPLGVGKGSLDLPEETYKTSSFLKKQLNDEGRREKGTTSTVNHIEAVAGISSEDAHSSESNKKNMTDTSTQIMENRELSRLLPVEPIKARDSAKNEEEDTNSLPQDSTSDAGLFSKDKSPRAHNEHIEFRKPEDSSYQANETSLYEYLEGTGDADIEGKSMLDRLKQQVEQDKVYMDSLYKELEEERNAAAVAANETMAMITRLQEEKASLHMEALQYLRMMEEQAEYDVEALERANDVIAEKEKELQDLEAELEFYRNNFGDESLGADKENNTGASSDSRSYNIKKTNGTCNPAMDDPASKFADEKLYILRCLKKLEKKIHQAQNDEKMKNEVGNIHRTGETPISQENEDNGSFEQKNVYPSNGNPDHDREINFVSGKREKPLENGPSAFEKEIAELHQRLDALETDQDFLKHVSDLLHNGKDGLNLIQEISHQLRELRKVESHNKR
ncbi:probable myosin-binding protein 4 [Primulina eburnea]|uniref:probable myosin-binding protein 4 n=1 Tax=Primulina eburnea TaxID=1245227 RepID=UPI003C6C0762